MQNRFIGAMAFALLGSVVWASGGGCTSRDCSEERAGQVRCVANRAELCEADGSLTYTSCAVSGLVCSAQHGGCVTEEVLNTTTASSGGAGGVGGTSSNTGGSPTTSNGGGGAASGGMGGSPAGSGGTAGAGG